MEGERRGMRNRLTDPPDPEDGLVLHGAGAAEAPKTVMAARMTLVNCILMVWSWDWKWTGKEV